MTPAEFRAWMDRLKFNWEDAADALSVTTRSVRRYADGSVTIPAPVERLCGMVEAAKRGRHA